MSAPVGNTCPDIDKVISSIESAQKSAVEINHLVNNEPDASELDDIRYAADNIENELYHLKDELEHLRDCNTRLREWGEELELENEQLKNQYEN